MINPASRLNSIELSLIRKMFEVTNPNAINLGIGEPDFNVPENIKEAMKRSIDENDTHYTPNKGYLDLREEITKKFKKENGITTTPEDVIVTVGASEGLYMDQAYATAVILLVLVVGINTLSSVVAKKLTKV